MNYINSIRYTQEQLYVTPKMSIAMQNSALTPSIFISGQHFLETFMLLPETTRTTNSRWLQHFSPQTANTTFATLWWKYLLRTSNNTHCFLNSIITLNHSLTSFLPTRLAEYVDSLFHAAIKNYHKNISTSYFSLLYIPYKLSEETTQRKHTHARYNLTFAEKQLTNIYTRLRFWPCIIIW